MTYIIDTCTRIVICTSLLTDVIDTYIRIFVRTFVRVLINDTYICIFVRTFVRVSVIDTLHIDFFTTCSIFLLSMYIIILLKSSTHHLPWIYFGSSFNTTYSFAPFLKPSFDTTPFVAPFQAQSIFTLLHLLLPVAVNKFLLIITHDELKHFSISQNCF